jgi:2-iminobutanoate/2-iminopropanoate deaminase
MVMARFFNSDGVPKPASNYSQAVEMPAGGRRLIISGQVGMLPDGRLLQGYERQAEQAWNNVLAILADAGMGSTDIVKIIAYDVAPGNVAAYRAVRDRMLGGHTPAATYVVVAGLASPDFLTEIEVEAVAEPERTRAKM